MFDAKDGEMRRNFAECDVKNERDLPARQRRRKRYTLL